jgi:hypothetical protein
MSLIRFHSCRRCKFGEPIGPDGMVECRRYPPAVTALALPNNGRINVAMQATFPKLQPDQYCGEWAPKLHRANDDAMTIEPEPPIAAIAEAA